jgi:hypothetical protein
MARKVICTCLECIQHHRVVLDGQEMPGCRVTQQLRRVHEIVAAANRAPEYAQGHTSKVGNSHPVGVEEFFEEEGDGKNKAKSSSKTSVS